MLLIVTEFFRVKRVSSLVGIAFGSGSGPAPTEPVLSKRRQRLPTLAPYYIKNPKKRKNRWGRCHNADDSEMKFQVIGTHPAAPIGHDGMMAQTIG
jgi:hypothetical protein